MSEVLPSSPSSSPSPSSSSSSSPSSSPSPSEIFKNIFQDIITTQPNTIERDKIEILAGLIVNTDSGLSELTIQYIDPLIQITLGSDGFYRLCTTPEFIKNIWMRIKAALIAKLDTDIESIEFPVNYNELNAVKKCEHVGHILKKLDTIHNNLCSGAVSLFSHTLQELSGDLKDKITSRQYTIDSEPDAIKRFAKRTQTSISFIIDDMQDFSRRFLSTRRMLPQMCHRGRNCKIMKDAYHRMWFVHPFGKTPFYFESLVLLPEKPSNTYRASPYGGSNSLRSKINLKKTKYIRTKRHTTRRRRTKHRRRH
jgi:hypothetical protein